MVLEAVDVVDVVVDGEVLGVGKRPAAARART